MSNTVISCVKVRNRFSKFYPELDTELKNIRVNRELRGCSGFIFNPSTEKYVYISTEVDPGAPAFSVLNQGYLYREAESDSDYTGGRNHFADDLDSLVHSAALLCS